MKMWSLRLAALLVAATVVPACKKEPPPANGLNITTTSLAASTINIPYSRTLQVVNNSGAVTWSLASGSLPAGVALNPATGVISGTPTASGTFNISVDATDSAHTDTQALSLVINPALAIPTALPDWTVGIAYSTTLSATGGTGSHTFAVTAGALPTGLSLNGATGAVTGTPTVSSAIAVAFTVTVTDSLGATGFRAYSVTINAAVDISGTSYPDWTVGIAYSKPATRTGGTAPFAFSISVGTLPAGIAIDPLNGTLSGTPTTAGALPVSFTLRVQDAAGDVDTIACSITIHAAPAITTTTMTDWTRTHPGYSQTPTVTGGTAPLAFALAPLSGPLPTSLLLDSSTGEVHGTPSAAGSFSFTLRVTDAAGAFDDQAYTVVINAVLSAPSALSSWTVNQAFTQTVTATNGTGVHTFAVSAGSLPPGMTLNSDGSFTGGPNTVAGSPFGFTITATDFVGYQASTVYSLAINAAVDIAATTLGNWTINQASYSQTPSSSGGTAPYTWSLNTGSGPIPTSLLLNSSTGALTGTPSAAGTFTFTLKLVDAAGSSDTQAYTVIINGMPDIDPTAMLPWTVTHPGYSQTPGLAGGTAPFTWNIVVGGAIPTGMSFDTSTGQVSGTPTATAGSPFTFTLRVVDAAGAIDTQGFSITINPVLTAPSALTAWTINRPFTQSVTATGGTGTHTFTVGAGLPPGMTLNSDGSFTGSPTSLAGSPYGFTITAQDAAGFQSSTLYSLTINPVVDISATTLANHTVGIAGYSQTPSSSGGTSPYTWTLNGGSGPIPSGLSLDGSTGALTGTPDTAASYTFTLKVVDAAGSSDTQAYTVVINPLPTIDNSVVFPNWTKNHPYTAVPVTASGGTGTLTVALVPLSTLPSGLTLTSNSVSGTPDTVGTTVFSLKVTDLLGGTTTHASYSVTINDVLTFTTSTLPPWTETIAYTPTIVTAGGTGTRSTAVTTGSAPTGLTLGTNGSFTGTPSVVAAGTTFTVTVTDFVGATATHDYSIDINAFPAFTTTSLPAWTKDHPGYPGQLDGTGGTSPVTLSMVAGTLPTGLTLNTSTGKIVGTPTVVGTQSNLQFQAVDAAGATVLSNLLSITINDVIALSPGTLTAGTQSVAYSQSVSSTGGTGAVTLSTLDSPPAGLTFVNGLLSGTTLVKGTFSITVDAIDTVGATKSMAVGFTINANVPTITTAALPDITQSVYYHAVLTASGGAGTLTWTKTGGDPLPTGLTFNGAGTITGTTAAAPATLSIQVTATDSGLPTPNTAVKTFSYKIRAAAGSESTLALEQLRVPDGQEAVLYTDYQLTTTNGTATGYALSPLSRAMPSGMSITAGGMVTGTPAASTAGRYTVMVRTTDGSGFTDNPLLIVVRPAVDSVLTIDNVNFPTVPQFTRMTPQQILVSGGEAPYHITFAEGTQPHEGQYLTQHGVFYGCPTSHSTVTLRIQAMDSAFPPRVVVKTLLHSVTQPASPAFGIKDQSPLNGKIGTVYGPLSWNYFGTPAVWIAGSEDIEAVGLSFNFATGEISGTPTRSGLVNFIIAAADSSSPRRSDALRSQFQILPKTGEIGVTTLLLPNVRPGIAYSKFLASTPAATAWTLDTGAGDALPAGLNFDTTTGEIYGTVTTSGSSDYRLIFTATDGTTSTAAVLTLTVDNEPTGFSAGTGSESKPYQVAPPQDQSVLVGYELSLSGGNQDSQKLDLFGLTHQLPPGLSMDRARFMASGTTSIPGWWLTPYFASEQRDGSGGGESPTRGAEVAVLTQVRAAAGFKLSTFTLPAGQVGADYEQTLRVESPPGTTAYAFSVSVGELPPGLTLDPDNGTLTGQPTSAGVFEFTVVVDQGGNLRRRHYRVPVDPPSDPFLIETLRLPDATLTVDYASAVLAPTATSFSDAGSAKTFADLGLALDTSTGAVTGTPTGAEGLYAVRVTVSDGSTTRTTDVEIRVLALELVVGGLLPIGFNGEAYAHTLVPSGGDGSYTLAFEDGTPVPPGMTLTGSSLGGPLTASTGFIDVAIRITDGSEHVGVCRLSFIAFPNANPAVLDYDADFNDNFRGTVGVGFSESLGTHGGMPPTSLSGSPTGLPDGLSPTGLPSPLITFFGTPTASGDFWSTVTVADSTFSDTADHLFIFQIEQDNLVAPIYTRRLPDGKAGQAYPTTRLHGGTGSATLTSWSLGVDAPVELTMDTPAQGLFSGTAMSAGTYRFHVTLSDSTGTSDGLVTLVVRP